MHSVERKLPPPLDVFKNKQATSMFSKDLFTAMFGASSLLISDTLSATLMESMAALAEGL